MISNFQLLQQGAEAKVLLDEKNNRILKDRISKSYRIKEIDYKIRKQRTRSEIKLLEKSSKIINVPLPFSDNINNKSNKKRGDKRGSFQKEPTMVENGDLENPTIAKKKELLPGGGRVGTNGGKDNFQIKMPFIEGKKLSEHLDNLSPEKQKQIMIEIGKSTAELHKADIIHGDLTTSNMILAENSASQMDKKVVNKKYKESLSELTHYQRRNPAEPISEQHQSASVSERIFFIDFGLGYISKKIEDKAVDLHLLKQALEAKHFKNWEILFKEFEKSYSQSYGEAKKIFERLKAVEKRGRYRH